MSPADRHRTPRDRARIASGPGRNGALARVREMCLSLPETSERESHGAPSFFVAATRMFVAYRDNHHGDGRLALWCAAPAGFQREQVEREPDAYFLPPYVGRQGWIGVRLDRSLAWDEVAGVIEDAWLTRAGPRLVARLGDTSGGALGISRTTETTR